MASLLHSERTVVIKGRISAGPVNPPRLIEMRRQEPTQFGQMEDAPSTMPMKFGISVMVLTALLLQAVIWSEPLMSWLGW
jgi:hypothetical protein